VIDRPRDNSIPAKRLTGWRGEGNGKRPCRRPNINPEGIHTPDSSLGTIVPGPPAWLPLTQQAMGSKLSWLASAGRSVGKKPNSGNDTVVLYRDDRTKRGAGVSPRTKQTSRTMVCIIIGFQQDLIRRWDGQRASDGITRTSVQTSPASKRPPPCRWVHFREHCRGASYTWIRMRQGLPLPNRRS
jgi:hypothetical protein